MATHFQLFPTSASTLSSGVDHLFLFLVSVSAVMVAIIFLTILVFAIKYRRRPGNMVAKQIRGSTPLEIWWSVVPFVIMLGFFAWGAVLYFHHADPPGDASVIYVVGKQWMWKFQHPEGPREINELHIPIGKPIKLVMTSEDVIHSLYIPAFRIKQDVLPGRYTQEWFQATLLGTYHLFCSEYCGTNHSQMEGWVHAMNPVDYQRWLSGGAPGKTMPASGEDLFHTLGCATCHVRNGPPLQGLYGSRVALSDGTVVVADDAYIRESILDPTAQIVKGYPPIMPTYKGQVTEEGLLQLIAYIKSLAGEAPGSIPPEKGNRK
jgi:cytochrome c oxidase subunit 2